MMHSVLLPIQDSVVVRRGEQGQTTPAQVRGSCQQSCGTATSDQISSATVSARVDITANANTSTSVFASFTHDVRTVDTDVRGCWIGQA